MIETTIVRWLVIVVVILIIAFMVTGLVVWIGSVKEEIAEKRKDTHYYRRRALEEKLRVKEMEKRLKEYGDE